MSDFNPVQFGQFLAKVEALTEKLTEAEKSIDALTERLTQVESRYKVGKGALAGLAIGAGFAVLGVKDTLNRIVNSLLP